MEERSQEKNYLSLILTVEKKGVVRKTFSNKNMWEVVEPEQSCGILDNEILHKELSV